jgi:16S rRNA (adenine1518-N6/adenine1519-N6)-dimethyltransferase
MRKTPLGQNFLIDLNIAQNIIQLAQIQAGESVIEIGPGKGVLTQTLINQADSLTAIELDPQLSKDLQKRFGHIPNFKLIEGDAAKFDYASLGVGLKVISNLPYYAATHIMKKLIHYQDQIRSMTLMLQKEVVDRLTAKPGQREYGSLSVFVQYHCDVKRLLEIPNNAFSPKPKIDSSLIGLTPLPQPKVQVENQKLFFKLVNSAFLHKRKMLKNNLKDWEYLFHQGSGHVQLAGIDLSRRGETLSLEDFADLANHVHAHTAV